MKIRQICLGCVGLICCVSRPPPTPSEILAILKAVTKLPLTVSGSAFYPGLYEPCSRVRASPTATETYWVESSSSSPIIDPMGCQAAPALKARQRSRFPLLPNA